MASFRDERTAAGVALSAEERATWSDCPGCPKCRDNDGYVLRKGSGRPTCAVEVVLMFSRGDVGTGYYYDTEAVKQPLATKLHAPGNVRIAPEKTDRGHLEDRVWGSESGANARNYLILSPEPLSEAHFAAFPTKLVDFCVKAGSSERGVCPECLMPWARVVERTPMVFKPSDTHLEVRAMGVGSTRTALRGTQIEPAESRTLGWRATCRCDREPIPSLVLDPFSGSGRTLIAALRLGRRAVGLELNESYVAMSRRLVTNDSPLFNHQAEDAL